MLNNIEKTISSVIKIINYKIHGYHSFINRWFCREILFMIVKLETM